jgi:hypothetical protein
MHLPGRAYLCSAFLGLLVRSTIREVIARQSARGRLRLADLVLHYHVVTFAAQQHVVSLSNHDDFFKYIKNELILITL